MDAELAQAIERAADLKGELLSYVREPRFRRSLGAALDEAADPDGILGEEQTYRAVDNFLFSHRMPNGGTIIDNFLRHHRGLSTDDKEMLRGWRDPVEGIFEVQHKDKDSVLTLNLIDNLEYRMYSNMGPRVFRPLGKGWFAQGRLVPVAGSWVISGCLSLFPKSGAARIAQAAAQMALRFPEVMYRNKELLDRSWEMQERKRQEFVAAFGSDEVVLPRDEAERRVRDLGYPADMTATVDGDTVGVIFDAHDGLGIFAGYHHVREMFAEPSLAKDEARAETLLGYLRSDLIKPAVLRRLAAENPDHVDAVYRTVLRQRHFSWAAHGEALLRKHKAWYFDQEQYPGVTVVGPRLSELLTDR